MPPPSINQSAKPSTASVKIPRLFVIPVAIFSHSLVKSGVFTTLFSFSISASINVPADAVIETIFDAVYLVSVITIGILMIRGSKGSKQFRLFGLMAVVLGAGDSFHLIPRALALCTTGLENYTVPLGLGKWITSVTMTVFYVLLYYVWRQRYQIKGKSLQFRKNTSIFQRFA